MHTRCTSILTSEQATAEPICTSLGAGDQGVSWLRRESSGQGWWLAEEGLRCHMGGYTGAAGGCNVQLQCL